MVIVGIDPGLRGAVACFDASTNTLVDVQDIPIQSWATPRGKKVNEINEAMLAKMIVKMNPDTVVIERVSAMPGQGVTSMFNFGMGFGMIRGVIGGLGIPYELTQSNVWKKHYRLGSDKAMSRVTATRLFPEHAELFSRVKDDGRAEAALLARFRGGFK